MPALLSLYDTELYPIMASLSTIGVAGFSRCQAMDKYILQMKLQKIDGSSAWQFFEACLRAWLTAGLRDAAR